MALQIKTTGYEDYLDGSGNIKMLVIGGPDAGKTRSSSYWPKPFYMDCENSRGSLSDRQMPYVEVKNSRDALDALTYLKSLESTPKKDRRFQTVVFDTLDAFQRSVKDEWLQDTKAGSFKGYDAWGYLDTKMSMLMTRLLNLDYNVLVLAHYKDKTLKDDDGKETRELMLQLQGDIKDSAFNDFGLVGWLGTYWETNADKGRVEKRGLTFQKTVEKPFLKDRFHILPNWVPIEFEEGDYLQIYNAFLDQIDVRDLVDSAVVGEVPDAGPELPVTKVGNVVAPLIGGPVPPQAPSVLTVEDMSKPQLLETVAREGVTGVKGNALKAELIVAIKAFREAAAGATVAPTEPLPPTRLDPAAVHAAAAAAAAPKVTPYVEGEPVNTETGELTPDAGPASPEESTRAAVLDAQRLDPKSEHWVDPEPTVEAVAAALPATVIAVEEKPAPPAKAVDPADFMAGECAQCGKSLADQSRDYVRLSFIKYRRGYLCDADYAAAKAAGK
jgi:hypothetical protein